MGPIGEEQAKDFSQRVEQLEKQAALLQREVQCRQDQYEVASANKPLRDKYQLAIDNGLAESALNALITAPDPIELFDRIKGGGTPLAQPALCCCSTWGGSTRPAICSNPARKRGTSRRCTETCGIRYGGRPRGGLR